MDIEQSILEYKERRARRIKINRDVENYRKRREERLSYRVDDFEESEHPRAKDGKFKKKGSSDNEIQTIISKEPEAKHSEKKLAIDTPEARELYDRIKNEDYLSIEELKNHPVVKQLDEISKKYDQKYGNTVLINTPERKSLRKDIENEFLSYGSMRAVKSEDGSTEYEHDGELSKDYFAEIVIGLPASGKSTRIANPDSEKFHAFVFDSDIIKESIPEMKESNGGAANAIHLESRKIQHSALKQFTNGKMKGTNLIIPVIGADENGLFNDYITTLENAGYRVKIRFQDANPTQSLNRVIMRAIKTGRIIPSGISLNYGDKPRYVWESIRNKKNRKGEPYGI